MSKTLFKFKTTFLRIWDLTFTMNDYPMYNVY